MMRQPISVPFGTVPVTFTLDELWLIADKVKHEPHPQLAEMKYPPGNLELNQLIIEAVVACTDCGLEEFTVPLSFGDCLAIGWAVPPDIVDADGRHIGRDILLKLFRARVALLYGEDSPAAHEPSQPVKAEVMRKLAAMEVCDAADEDGS